MAEYIEREKVLALADDFELQLPDDEIFFSYIPIGAVRKLPAADVRPVKRGKWERTSKSLYACSECGNCVVDERIAGMFYCPNCGAKMEES